MVKKNFVVLGVVGILSALGVAGLGMLASGPEEVYAMPAAGQDAASVRVQRQDRIATDESGTIRTNRVNGPRVEDCPYSGDCNGGANCGGERLYLHHQRGGRGQQGHHGCGGAR